MRSLRCVAYERCSVITAAVASVRRVCASSAARATWLDFTAHLLGQLWHRAIRAAFNVSVFARAHAFMTVCDYGHAEEQQQTPVEEASFLSDEFEGVDVGLSLIDAQGLTRGHGPHCTSAFCKLKHQDLGSTH